MRPLAMIVMYEWHAVILILLLQNVRVLVVSTPSIKYSVKGEL